jgi:hypothetical protein
MEMVHVFLLTLYLGSGDQRKLVSQDMFFYDLRECNWYASEIVKRYGNYEFKAYLDPKDRATAYCLPKVVSKDIIGKTLKVY